MKSLKQGKKLKSIIILIILLSYKIAWAINVEEVVRKHKERFQNFKDYEVDFVITSKIRGPKGKDCTIARGKTFVKGDRQYIDINTTANGQRKKTIQVFDGRVYWVFDKSTNTVRKVDLFKIPKDLHEKVMEGLIKTKVDFAKEGMFGVEEKFSNGRKFYVLTSKERINQGNLVLDKIVYWIDAEEYLLYKAEMFGKLVIKIPGGTPLELETELIQEFMNWKLNIGIPDSRFVFTVPNGVVVVDTTEQMKVMLEMLRDLPLKDTGVRGEK